MPSRYQTVLTIKRLTKLAADQGIHDRARIEELVRRSVKPVELEPGDEELRTLPDLPEQITQAYVDAVYYARGNQAGVDYQEAFERLRALQRGEHVDLMAVAEQKDMDAMLNGTVDPTKNDKA